MGTVAIRRLKQLEEVSRKRFAFRREHQAEAACGRPELGQDDAAGCPEKKVRLVRRRELVRHLETAYAVSQRRARSAAGFGPVLHRYTSRRDRSAPLPLRLRELAEAGIRYGYRRLRPAPA